MDAVTFLICFIIVIRELFSKGDMNTELLIGGIIGLGLASIANAISNYISRIKNERPKG